MKPEKVKLPIWAFNVKKHKKAIVRWLKNHKIPVTSINIKTF